MERDRGGCLTAFLGLMLVVNTLVALVYLGLGASIAAQANMPYPVVLALGAVSGCNVAFAWGVWTWKKWGIYGFCGSAAVAFVTNMVFLGVGGSLSGLLGPAILLALVYPQWEHFE